MEWGYNPTQLLNAKDKKFECMPEMKRLSLCPQIDESVKETTGTHSRPLQELCEDYTPITPKTPYPNGFMWSEYNVKSTDATTYDKERKVFSCSEKLTQAIIEAASQGKNPLRAVIRAHQHAPTNPIMKKLFDSHGCTKLWNAKNYRDISLEDRSVLTLLLSPDSNSGLSIGRLASFNYVTFIRLKVAPRLENCEIKMVNREVIALKKPQTDEASNQKT
jgi:hypothetical protein